MKDEDTQKEQLIRELVKARQEITVLKRQLSENTKRNDSFQTTEEITQNRRAEHLQQTLNKAALAIEKALTTEDIFHKIKWWFRKLGFSCMVFEVGDNEVELKIKYTSFQVRVIKAITKIVGFPPEEFSISLEESELFNKVVNKKKSVFIKNTEKVIQSLLPEPKKGFARQIVTKLGISKAILAPLRLEDKVNYVITVHSDELMRKDMPAITAFTDRISAIWQKTQLMQEQQKSLEKLKRIQAQLLQVQKMEAIGTLAGGVAHDFNNMLTAIQGYTGLAMMKIDASDPSYRYLNQIQLAALRAGNLTKQLLLFSRRQPMKPRVFNINKSIEDLLVMLKRLIGENITFVIQLEPTIWAVRADVSRVESVIMNLSINARDAMPEGGELTIRTENVVVDEDYCKIFPEAHPGKFVRLTIADTGIGMEDETIQHIFEPFFTTKEIGKGTGIGLSVVYGIVKQHKGWINVHSEPNHGSLFYIYLPASPEEPPEEVEEIIPMEELKGNSEWILLVEDEKEVRSFAATALRNNGYVVFKAKNAQEALQVFEKVKEKLALVFTDVVLPVQNGLDLVEQLLPRKPELRVLMCSGYEDERAQLEVIRQRGFRFLQKPYEPAQLLRAVKASLKAP